MNLNKIKQAYARMIVANKAVINALNEQMAAINAMIEESANDECQTTQGFKSDGDSINGKALLTITETAKVLGISRPTAYILAKRGQLDAAVVSGVRRITAKSINKYLAQFEGKGWGK